MAAGYDASQAVYYHYGAFPPSSIDYRRIATPLAEASAAIASYDQMLKGMHNSRLFLSPLQRQEAVSSSRMEGTITTLDELLRYEAEIDGDKSVKTARQETLEVHAYRMSMVRVQTMMAKSITISTDILCEAHKKLLSHTRGHEKEPGSFKTEQNYLADSNQGRIMFIPIDPSNLQDGLGKLFSYINESDEHALIRTALAHVEFEALHPFNDGNGRIGRILITLMLWKLGMISSPYFYISGYLERRKDDYIERMRAVSADGHWTEWCEFFLEALREQAQMNVAKSEEIRALYETMKEDFREILSSKWSIMALDFLFGNPVFRNNRFTATSGVPKGTANRFTRALLDAGMLITIEHPSGRRPGLYAFEPLLRLIRL